MQSPLVIVFAVFLCMHSVFTMAIEDMSDIEQREKRDVTWDKEVGKGKVFGTLGQNEQGLFGKGGYKQDIFNDNRGKLLGEAYGSRVLGPNGDASLLGGKLDWSSANKDAAAMVELTKQIHGPTNLEASASKVWNFDKNTRLSTGGMLMQELGRGKPDYGVGAKFEHNW